MERRKYDREFKTQAMQLCEQEGVSVAQIARELGIDVKLLYRWRDNMRQSEVMRFRAMSSAAARLRPAILM